METSSMSKQLSVGRNASARLGLIGLSVLLACPLVAAAGWPPEIGESTRQAFTFSLELAPPAWQAGMPTADGEATVEPVLPGFVNTASPGQARLPRRGFRLIVPPGTVPRLETIAESWRDLDGRRLMTEPVPVMVEDPQTGEIFEQAMPLPADRDLPRDRIPASVLAELDDPDVVRPTGPAVRLGDVSWWRGRRIVTVTVIPVRDDGRGQAARALARGEWRVRFVADETAGKTIPAPGHRRLTTRGDERFAGQFLNGALMTQLSTEAAHGGQRPVAKARTARKGTPLGYPDVRVPVNRTQLYRIRHGELVAAGLLPDGAEVRESELRLYQRRYLEEVDDPLSPLTPPYVEVEVPIHVVGEGDVFADDDLLLFWGLRPADDGAFTAEIDGTVHELPDAGDLQELHNEHNVYWLQYAEPDPGESWARMPEVPMPAAGGEPLDSYRRLERFESAVAYRENVPAITVDRYYYNGRMAEEVDVPLNVWSPVPGQADAVLRAGVANNFASARTMAFDLMQDGAVYAPLPPFELPSSLYERIYTTTLPAGALDVDGIGLRMQNENTALRVFAWLDWVELDYRAEYAAPGGRLRFPGGDPDVSVGDLEVSGFADVEVGMVEITDPRNPVLINLTRNNLIEGDGVTLSLQVDQSQGQRWFYAANRMFSNGVPDIDYGEAETSESVSPAQLMGDRADVIVVTPPEFREATEGWIEYRQGRDPDLTFHVVEPQALYDWYSGGLKSPWGIKRLVNHALQNPAWGTWALVLVGDANENPRELGVPSDGRAWSRDWVPTHFHVQDIGQGLSPEVLGSDEWFGNPAAGDEINFPGGNHITDPASLYIGRIPCNSVEEFERVLAKIELVENDDGNQPWRRRGVFMSDDAWSSGTLNAEGFTIEYDRGELAFERSQNNVQAVHWRDNAGMVALEADSMMLRPFMEPLHPDTTMVVSLTDARNFCEESDATESLVNTLNAGATLAHFQGHANHWLWAHESWFVDDRRNNYRTDVDLITNVGRPWLFCGMGCHLGDYIQNVAGSSGAVDPGVSEKFLVWLDGGAVATYASSGYEFLSINRQLSELFSETMMITTPTATIDGEAIGSRWMLGELMWRAEADFLAISQSRYVREAVYQYTILGDPLLMLDAGPPEVDAELVGSGPLDAETELEASDATGLRVVELQARDEAGIDRLRVRDSEGNDLTATAVEATPFYDDGRTHIMDYVITLPVRPFAHDITIDVHDAADRLDTDHHPSFTLSVAHDYEATFTADGEPVDPLTFAFTPGDPVDFDVVITSAAWLDDETQVEVEGDGLTVTGVTTTVVDSDRLEVGFTATAPGAKAERGVRVVIDGFETYVALESSADPPAAGIAGLVNFPNPMREATRFVFGTDATSGRGKVRVWTVSGRSVADIAFNLAGGGQEMVSWDGRDREGDRLANGTYLYRVELEGPSGSVRSDMQRLVIMR
ncbi:hypothetical protein GF314_02950 [bacterium]|nr:hypothetical protein [bacterium]